MAYCTWSKKTHNGLCWASSTQLQPLAQNKTEKPSHICSSVKCQQTLLILSKMQNMLLLCHPGKSKCRVCHPKNKTVLQEEVLFLILASEPQKKMTYSQKSQMALCSTTKIVILTVAASKKKKKNLPLAQMCV